MNRVRVSTTVNAELLEAARRARPRLRDSALLDAALAAFLARNRAAEIDADYAAYDQSPIATRDDWGDLEAFREAAARS